MVFYNCHADTFFHDQWFASPGSLRWTSLVCSWELHFWTGSLCPSRSQWNALFLCKKIPGSGIKPFQTAVDGSEQYCLCIAGRKMSYYSRAGYRACLHKREKTFQRTYLKWFCNRSGDHPQGHFGFSTIFPLQWTAGQTYFSLSLFHASKEETSESLSFTYCPKWQTFRWIWFFISPWRKRNRQNRSWL